MSWRMAKFQRVLAHTVSGDGHQLAKFIFCCNNVQQRNPCNCFAWVAFKRIRYRQIPELCRIGAKSLLFFCVFGSAFRLVKGKMQTARLVYYLVLLGFRCVPRWCFFNDKTFVTMSTPQFGHRGNESGLRVNALVVCPFKMG